VQTWSQIQRTSTTLRYVNCGPGHIQCSTSCAYSVFSIQLNVSALLLEISRQFYARYSANLEPNTAHIYHFTLCELWSRTYTMKWQLRIFRLQYSTERICAPIGDIPTIQCALYCKRGAKYSAHPPVYIMSTVVPVIYQCSYSSAYSGLNIQLNISALLLEISRICNARHTANLVPNTAHTLLFALCELWSRPYTTKWQHRILSLQYSTERICAAIGEISTIQWALYCNLGTKSAHPTVNSI
jgi:hypothetical protein